jgi:hypothetical protein
MINNTYKLISKVDGITVSLHISYAKFLTLAIPDRQQVKVLTASFFQDFTLVCLQMEHHQGVRCQGNIIRE